MLIDPIAKALGEWAVNYSISSICLRIMVAVIFSAIIGWERANKRHSAGVRTFTLVSLGGTCAGLLDSFINGDKGTYVLSAAVIIGISSITISSIIYSSRNQIKGLTTSVALWACCIMGLSIGVGCYTITCVIFLAIFCTLSLFPSLEHSLKDHSNHFEVHLELVNSSFLQNFVTTIRKLGLTIDDIEMNPAYQNSGLSVYSIAISISSQELKKYKSHKEIIEALGTLDYIYHIEEMQS